jgi:hypothetical protein
LLRDAHILPKLHTYILTLYPQEVAKVFRITYLQDAHVFPTLSKDLGMRNTADVIGGKLITIYQTSNEETPLFRLRAIIKDMVKIKKIRLLFLYAENFIIIIISLSY